MTRTPAVEHSPTHNPRFRVIVRRALAATAVALLTAATGLATSPPAVADHGITTTGEVNLRSGPGTGYEVLGVVPVGVSPRYLCWAPGEDVNGVSVWFKVQYEVEGYISSYFDDSSYATPDDIAATYGIEQCTSDSSVDVAADAEEPLGNAAPLSCTGPASEGATYSGRAACAWAVANALEPSRFPPNDCTWFVSQALWEGGLDASDEWTGASFDYGRLAARNPSNPGFGFPGPTTTATQANKLVAYLVDRGLATKTAIDWSDNTAAGAQIGDVIAYHWNPVGPGQDPSTDYIDHLAIVTGFEGDYPLVSQHTPQQRNRGWSWSESGHDWVEYAVTARDKSIEPQAWLIHIE